MRLSIFLLSLLLTTSIMAQYASFRQLLIFKNDKDQPIVQQQLEALQKANAGVKDRDLKITVVEKGNPLFEKYKPANNQFTVILIGKDGTEKYRTNEVLKTDKLFAIIDAMPMRRREMKDKDE